MSPDPDARPARRSAVRARRGWPTVLVAVVLGTMTACGSTVQLEGVAGSGLAATDGLAAPRSVAGAPAAGQLPADGVTGGGAVDAGAAVDGSVPGSVAGPVPGVDVAAPAAGVVTGGTSGVRQPASGQAPTGAPAAGGVASAAPAQIPAEGRGWDRKVIRIGVMTQQDVQSVAEGFGLSSVDSGDQVADVQAVVADLNARGGLFGRKVEPVVYDIKSAGDQETQGQAACSHFTQDEPVVAVYAMALVGDVPSFRSCMQKATMPVFAAGGQAFDDKVFTDLDGYYTLMTFPSWSRFAGPFLERLKAQGYYTGWNTTLGRAGTDPVKTAFLCPDSVIGRRVGAIVRRESARIGQPLSNETYLAAGSGDASGVVLRLKADAITHVLYCDLSLFAVATQAESQGYRPRYGISTFNTPVLFLQGTVPDAQLAGSVGVGFAPTLDVDAQRDPGKAGPAGEAACRTVAAKAGVSYDGKRRLAQGILYDTCDILALVLDSARAAGSLTGPGIRQGLAVAGPRLRSAYTWTSGLSATERANPAAIRDLAFDSACRCYQYRGGLRPLR